MLYGRNVIFLPRYGDRDLYTRLAAHPECNVNLNGKTYPWPDRPLFLHDFIPRQRTACSGGRLSPITDTGQMKIRIIQACPNFNGGRFTFGKVSSGSAAFRGR